MRTALITGYDAAYKPLASLTVPLMYQYAERHSFDCRVYTTPLLDVPHGIYWTGVCGALEAFRDGYERVIYLDVDQAVTNPDVALDVPKMGFHASKDWGTDATELWHFSMCGFVAHRDCIPLFEECLAMEPQYRDKPFSEQLPMQEIARKLIQRGSPLINILPRKTFNAVPDAISPGNVPEPWDKSCWCAHLTMAAIETRIQIAKEILCQPQRTE